MLLHKKKKTFKVKSCKEDTMILGKFNLGYFRAV